MPECIKDAEDIGLLVDDAVAAKILLKEMYAKVDSVGVDAIVAAENIVVESARRCLEAGFDLSKVDII